MSSYLYINAKGYPVTRHSYSAGVEFMQWPYKYYLHRVLGWYEKDQNAAMIFGRAVEHGQMCFHLNGGIGGVEAFEQYWSDFKDKPLVYKDKGCETNWESLNRAGREMMLLYALRQPTLPIPINTKQWQVELRREMFPNTRLAGIEVTSKLDIVTEVQCQRGIVDVKTAAKPIDTRPNVAACDAQLRLYSWAAGIPDVALLVFIKSGHELEKGASVALLQSAGPYSAGAEAVVAQVMKDTPSAILVPDGAVLAAMNQAIGDKPTSKEGLARKASFLSQHGVTVPTSSLTRQKIQYVSGVVSSESAKEAGDIAGYQIAAIVNANEKKFWPNTAGIRWPNDMTRDPYFRAFVLKDEKFRDEWFERRDEDWLDGDEQEAA